MFLLVTQTFGKVSEYRRALFAILSYKAWIEKEEQQADILVFTDNPIWFKEQLKEIEVDYVFLTPEKIRDMRGSIDFLHRMKIALIEEAFLKYPKHNLFYVDSDTFFLQNPFPFLKDFSSQMSFMHTHEYQFEEMRNLPLPGGAKFQAFLRLIEEDAFKLSKDKIIKILPDMSSWNAGVMILHREHFSLIKDVYLLTEAIYPPTMNHASEQYAFSIVLDSNTKLELCENLVYHYWYRIKKQIMDLFLSEKMNNEWSAYSFERKLKIVREWTKMLPKYLDNHVLMLRDNAIQTFNERKYAIGYKWAFKAIKKDFFGDLKFIKDVLYHLRKHISDNGK